jgi:DNA-binding IclR family transcriptional regulator
MRILEHVAAVDRPPTQSEVSGAVGIARSTVADVLGDLRELGYVTVSERRYLPGPALRSLATRVSDRPGLELRLRPVLERVAAETGETTMLSLVSGATETEFGELFAVDWVESNHPIRFVARTGPRRMYPSAAGKVFLAYAHRSPSDFPQEWLAPRTKRMLTRKKDIERELAHIRNVGYSINDGEAIEGLMAIAVPVFDHFGQVAAAVTVVGPSERLRDPVQQVLPTVRDALASVDSHQR